MEVGRTLGRVVLNARLYDRERHLVGELQELDRYKGELIATISHELKTPLTSIIGHIELLEDLDTGIGSVEAISRNADRLNRLVQNLLNYSPDPGQARDRAPPGRPARAGRAEHRADGHAGRAGQGRDDPDGARRAGDGHRRPRRARQGDRQPGQQRREVHPARRRGRPRGRHRRPARLRALRRHRPGHLRAPTRCTCSPPSTAPATPRRSRSPAPAWAWRSRAGSRTCTAARSWSPPSSARAAPSGCGCRCAGRRPSDGRSDRRVPPPASPLGPRHGALCGV